MRSVRRKLMRQSAVFVDYIYTDGRQAVMTDWIPLADTKIELRIRRVNAKKENGLYNTFFVSKNTDGLHEFSMNNGGTSIESNSYLFWNSKSYNNSNLNVRRTEWPCLDNGYVSTITMSSTEGILANPANTSKITLIPRDTDGDTKLLLFGSKSSAGVKSYNRGELYIYGVRCWNNGVLERDFVPVKKNGVYGLYDKINKRFWRSSTGVDFLGMD